MSIFYFSLKFIFKELMFLFYVANYIATEAQKH